MSSFIQFLNLTEKCRHMDVKNDKKPISEDPPICISEIPNHPAHKTYDVLHDITKL